MIESSVLNKLYKMQMRNKLLLISIVFVTIFLSFSFLTLIWSDPYFLIGALYGLLAFVLSISTLELLIYFFKNRKVSRLFGLLLYLIRIFWFLLFFCLALFLINPLLSDTDGVELLMRPINLVSFFIIYTLYSWSVYLLPLYDYLLKKIINKQIKNNILIDNNNKE